jgi:hypothetical protein
MLLCGSAASVGMMQNGRPKRIGEIIPTIIVKPACNTQRSSRMVDALCVSRDVDIHRIPLIFFAMRVKIQ